MLKRSDYFVIPRIFFYVQYFHDCDLDTFLRIFLKVSFFLISYLGNYAIVLQCFLKVICYLLGIRPFIIIIKLLPNETKYLRILYSWKSLIFLNFETWLILYCFTLRFCWWMKILTILHLWENFMLLRNSKHSKFWFQQAWKL